MKVYAANMKKQYQSDEDIRTPNGLLIGKRRKQGGKTFIEYKVGNKYEMITVEELIECITGVKLKGIIVIPEDITPYD